MKVLDCHQEWPFNDNWELLVTHIDQQLGNLTVFGTMTQLLVILK